jgi:transposase
MNKKMRKKYDQEFKQEAVKLVTEQGYKISEVARNLGIQAGIISRWKRELQAQRSGEHLGLDQQAELRSLREENRRLRMEREILKKAAAFFANESK